MTLCQSCQLHHFLRAAHYKSFSVVILVYYLMMEQNLIDITVLNIINAVQNVANSDKSMIVHTTL